MTRISEKIRECRRKKGMKQRELAEALGVTEQAVSKWENGRSLPDITLLMPLARVIDIGIEELLGGESYAE